MVYTNVMFCLIMSHYSRFYIIGLKNESSFWGNEPEVKLILFQGEGDSQWMEAHFPGGGDHDCGISRLVPEYPEDPSIILDSCMAFLPEVFEEIPDHALLTKITGSGSYMNLSTDKPGDWDMLRDECLEYMGRIDIRTFLVGGENP